MLRSFTEPQMYRTVHTAAVVFVNLSPLPQPLSSFCHIICSQNENLTSSFKWKPQTKKTAVNSTAKLRNNPSNTSAYTAKTWHFQNSFRENTEKFAARRPHTCRILQNRKYTGSAKKMYTQFNERNLYVVLSIIVNLQYISVNTTIWYTYLLQYNIYSYSSYMFRLLWVIFRH